MGQALVKKISKFASNNHFSFERKSFDCFHIYGEQHKLHSYGPLSTISKAVREYQNK